jgi:hypothetical protein
MGEKENVDYFAFGASKWDMSNVMVVAILMTYIGFNGIVDSTLSSLNVTMDRSPASQPTIRQYNQAILFSSRWYWPFL